MPATTHTTQITQFKLCPNTDLTALLDVQNFMSSLPQLIDGVVQYNNERAGATTIDDVCATMVAGPDALTQYYALIKCEGMRGLLD